jgi:serine/threonine-protein kinase
VIGGVALLPEGERQLLDRYQLVGEIATGGMATVYLARLAGLGGFQRMMAIKRLHPHLAREQSFIEMFLDEARLAARIHHRNVVPIVEIGTTGGSYYLVMEYIEGVTLARLMTQATAKHSPVPRPVLLRVMVDVLSGLHAAHEVTDDAGSSLEVVHRDCSPQNVLIGVDGCTRLTDFGIARATARIHNTREGAMKGKLAYMAPEQTQGDVFDRRADLWSVGVMLWEVLSMRRLFKGKTEAQTLRKLLHDPIPRLSEVVGGVHETLDDVTSKALEREPEARFQTAAEMADAIERAARVAGEPIASERNVESLMKNRYHEAVAQQREAIRQWFQATPSHHGEERRSNVRGLIERIAAGDAAQVSDVPPSSAPQRARANAGDPPTLVDATAPASRPSVEPTGPVLRPSVEPTGPATDPAPATDRSWLSEPPRTAAPRSARSSVPGALGPPSSKKGETQALRELPPLLGEGAESDEGDTLIYDPTSAGEGAPPSSQGLPSLGIPGPVPVPVPPGPPSLRDGVPPAPFSIPLAPFSEPLAPVPKSGGSRYWIVAVLVATVLVAAGVVLLREGSAVSDAITSDAAESSPGEAAPATAVPPPSSAASAASSADPSERPVEVAAPGADNDLPARMQGQPRSAPRSKRPSPAASAAASSPPGASSPVDEDLSNPYR